MAEAWVLRQALEQELQSLSGLLNTQILTQPGVRVRVPVVTLHSP